MKAATPALAVLVAFAAGPPAATGRVTGTVTLQKDGTKRADASGVVVYVVGFEEKGEEQVVAEIVQKNRRFEPGLVAITAGQKVAFPNGDPLFHNVFSLSPARKFDLGQFRKGQSKDKNFPTPGVVEVYCNIHPEMAATILVLPNRRFAVTRADGSFEIAGVPTGTWPIYAYDRFATRPERGQVTVSANGTARVDFVVSQTRADFKHKNKYGEAYRDPDKYR